MIIIPNRRKGIIETIPPEKLQYLFDTSCSIAEVLRKIGLCDHGHGHETIHKMIDKYDLSTIQMKHNYALSTAERMKNSKVSIEDIIYNGLHPNYSSTVLSKRLVQEGIKEYKCEICGINSWNGKELTLQLHHKDGDHHNHNLDNLQLLCPNCHTQTDNYGGKTKNKRRPNDPENVDEVKKNIEKIKIIPISRDELKYKIRNMPISHIAKEYGVSNKTIRKWCILYKLPSTKKEINSITQERWDYI